MRVSKRSHRDTPSMHRPFRAHATLDIQFAARVALGTFPAKGIFPANTLAACLDLSIRFELELWSVVHRQRPAEHSAN